MWILDRILTRISGKIRGDHDPIVRHELFEKIPGGEWRRTRYQPEAIDFDQIEDAMPGCSYRLYARKKSGKFSVLWFEHLPGPGIVQGGASTSIAEMEAWIETMTRFGEMVKDVKGDIRGAFGWVFPEREQPGGWLWTSENKWVYQPPYSQPRGGMVRYWLTVMDSAVDRANRMDLTRCVRLLAAQLEAEAAEKSSPPRPQ